MVSRLHHEILYIKLILLVWSHIVFETCLVLDYSLFTLLHATLNCWLEDITDLVTMATTTWISHTNHGIMDVLSCHVYKGNHHHSNQNEPISGKCRITLQYISTNCHYILSCISQSHSSPRTIFTTLRGKDPNNIWEKNDQN